MPIYMRCSRCGKRILAGTKCECLKAYRKKRHQEYDTGSRDKRSKAFYNSTEWERTREAVLNLDDGIDVYVYMTTGKIMMADTAHHIEPVKDNWNRRLDPDNLMSLNHDTHSKIEQMYKKDKAGMEKLLQEMLERYRQQGQGRSEKF